MGNEEMTSVKVPSIFCMGWRVSFSLVICLIVIALRFSRVLEVCWKATAIPNNAYRKLMKLENMIGTGCGQ